MTAPLTSIMPFLNRGCLVIIAHLLLFQGIYDSAFFSLNYESDITKMHYFNPMVIICDINLNQYNESCPYLPGKMINFSYDDRALLIKVYQWELLTRCALGVGCIVFGMVTLLAAKKENSSLIFAVEIYILVMFFVYSCMYILAAVTVSKMTAWWWWFSLGYSLGIFWRFIVYGVLAAVLHMWGMKAKRNKIRLETRPG